MKEDTTEAAKEEESEGFWEVQEEALWELAEKGVAVWKEATVQQEQLSQQCCLHSLWSPVKRLRAF